VIGLTIDAIEVGDVAEIARRASDADIASFVESVGDYNPVHSDPAYAAATQFEEPIAPGIWTAGLISAVIGTRLPGPGAIYLSQDLKFLRPVKLGDVIRARVEVLETNRVKNRMRLRTGLHQPARRGRPHGGSARHAVAHARPLRKAGGPREPRRPVDAQPVDLGRPGHGDVDDAGPLGAHWRGRSSLTRQPPQADRSIWPPALGQVASQTRRSQSMAKQIDPVRPPCRD
jgi:3-hydroxybutyryl-CoA dehydratase